MGDKFYFRFLLMDFGHPMHSNSIYNIIKSLENVLTLGLAFSHKERELTFGIGILNSEFSIFELQSNLRKNYESVIKNLNAVLKMTKTNKVTVQEYKYLLSNSIETILCKFQKFKNINNFSSQFTDSTIQIAIVTKKSAPVLADILTDVTNKLQQNNPGVPLVNNYKIIQISNEQIFKDSENNKLIDWISCLDNPYNLECFLKEWLLAQPQQLRILLPTELNLEIKCQVEDCLVAPITTDESYRNSSLGTLQPVHDLKVINRVPLNGVSLEFVHGIPRRISPSSWGGSGCSQSEINWKTHKELCRELQRTGQGLLAKSVLPTETEKSNSYHFLTSDGDMLLMNEVAPEELYLPTRVSFSKAFDSREDESSASTMRICLEKIKLLDEYNPRCFSSGTYGHLKNYLMRSARKKTSSGRFDGKPCRKKHLGEKDDEKQLGDACENRKKRSKLCSETELEKVHPALLPPELVEKYRKINSLAFKLPELSQEYTI